MGGGTRPAPDTTVTRPPFVIRPASEADIPDVVRIEQASFADPWSADSFVTSIGSERMRFLVADEVARDTGGPIMAGYVIALVMATDAEIADIAVAPKARERGVGGLLLDVMMLDLRKMGVESLYLEVRESNASARALYESRSFIQVGRRKGYYRLPAEDALILRRDLGAI